MDSTRAGSNPRTGDMPAPRAGSPAPNKPGPDTAERGKRADQSARAKAQNANDAKKHGLSGTCRIPSTASELQQIRRRKLMYYLFQYNLI